MAIMDSGSNYSFFESVPKASVGRSAFDKSYINSFTCKQGQIVPCYTEYTMINDSYHINIESIINVINPPKVQLLSRQRAFYHFYWLSFAQIWKQAQIFFSKGRTVSQYTVSNNLTVPQLSLSEWKRGSLADYLGFNVANTNGLSSFTFSALKFMAYLRIVRDRYINQRLHCLYLENVASEDIEDDDLSAADAKLILDFMYPQDDADFRIGTLQWDALMESQTAIDYLFGECWYRNFADDYFTTAQTTPIYQNEPEVADVRVNGSPVFQLLQEFTDTTSLKSVVATANGIGLAAHSVSTQNTSGWLTNSGGITSGSPVWKSDSELYASSSNGSPRVGFNSHNHGVNNTYTVSEGAAADLVTALNKSIGINVGTMTLSGLTINAIRACESATLILEKMAKCPNGTYGEFASVMFGGSTPRSAQSFAPYYIGGDYQSIVFTQVVNTAGAQNGNIQGQITGRGLSAASGSIGHLESDDFGLIMGVVSIMPDTYYTTGLQREDTYLVAEDFYLPDRAQLGMQAILNKELYNDPTDSGQTGGNDDVYGYINRYDELRYRMNECHGLVAEGSGSYTEFEAMIQSRKFNSRPTLTPQFVSTKNNIDNDWLSVPDMPPYIIQVLNKVRAIRPIPYKAEPATFGM